MAINFNKKESEKRTPTSMSKSLCSKASNLSSCRYMKIDYTTDGSIKSSTNKHEESKKNKNASPYLTEDRIQLLSRITEKRSVRKKTTDFVSSFPLAVNIYKANSGEIKSLKKCNKKVKKSVLTLPNEQAPLPQECTVSDMNDSEYFNEAKDERKPKAKKRRSIQTGERRRLKSKGMEVFDRDARYCTQLNIDLDSSSTDTINQFTGDGKNVFKKRQNNISNNSSLKAHDVWTMLRNMNRFPFRPSPPGSEESVASIKKRKNNNKRQNNQMDTKFIETCRTEEFTYISSLVDKTPHNSQSSIDRITVIDKQDEYQEISKQVKLVKNKISSKEKSQKHLKLFPKNKFNTRAKQRNFRIMQDDNENYKIFHKKDEKQKMGNNFENKEKVEDNKCMVTNVANNNQFLECTNKCFYCHNNVNVCKNSNDNFNDGEDVVYAYSDSSNGDIINNVSEVTRIYEDKKKFNKLSLNESQSQINGITKVIVSKGPSNVLTKNADPLKRKKSLVTTMPSTALIPKLTRTEIKRRLAKIKFPFIILTKDEVSSTVKVADYEPPQFAGLDEHIWPFMRKWIKNDDKKVCTNYIEGKNCVSERSIYNINADVVENKNDVKNNKNSKNKRKNSFSVGDKNVMQLFHKEENVKLKATKSKPVRQFKDRMFQFLYKKPTMIMNEDNNKYFSQKATKQRDVSSDLVDVSTTTATGLVFPVKCDDILCKIEDKPFKQISCTPSKHLWGKGRWASDFIDNIIKKIRTGVYYNYDDTFFHRNLTKDDSVQTEIDLAKENCCKNCNQKTTPMLVNNKKTELIQSIPGFEDSLSDLRIESINKNQVAIKHCITNIVVQFDVALTFEINRMMQLKHSFSCIPLKINGSQSKIFKSETTIVNAVLPAELCSILPSIMRKITDSRVILPQVIDKDECQLSTITELKRCDSHNSIKKNIPVQITAASKFQNLRDGKFSELFAITCKNSSIKKSLDFHKEFFSSINGGLMAKINTNLLFNCDIAPVILHIFNLQQSVKRIGDNYAYRNNTSTCMKIRPYALPNKEIEPGLTKFKFISMTAGILNNTNLIINLSDPLINTFSDFSNKNNVSISMTLMHDEDKVNCIMSNMKVNFLYNSFQERYNNCKKLPNSFNLKFDKRKPNAVDKYTDPSKLSKLENCNTGIKYCVNNNRNKKMRFIKLYKKCKSMSSISNERSSFALSKINTLDDFFIALGSAKTLASIFDGSVERKILTSIKEMKNWMTDITPRQALLVLLLANKKDTSNLVRYRPVLLQGIAVNRITRASELEMEIEVIERENLNTFSQYEGISYLPASIENQDALLEELYWIAKTTASDYQRTFDDSSERLLKSLLEKRKKLNPSYLRVMARYVGLGLLKSTK